MEKKKSFPYEKQSLYSDRGRLTGKIGKTDNQDRKSLNTVKMNKC